jgi:hypothetical protein
VALLNGFFPTVGDPFSILFYSARNGNFAALDGLDLGGGVLLDPLFADTSLTLVAIQS